MFFAVMVKSGFSLAKGSGCAVPGLKSWILASAGDLIPPSHAGIVPAALPAFSPPSE